MPIKYRNLRKKLKKYGIVEIKSGGKSSERIFFQESTGRFYPIKCHGESFKISSVGRLTNIIITN